jgi:hypothetical protein
MTSDSTSARQPRLVPLMHQIHQFAQRFRDRFFDPDFADAEKEIARGLSDKAAAQVTASAPFLRACMISSIWKLRGGNHGRD